MVVMKLLALMLRNPSCGLYRPLSFQKSVTERQLLEKVITDFGHEFYARAMFMGIFVV